MSISRMRGSVFPRLGFLAAGVALTALVLPSCPVPELAFVAFVPLALILRGLGPLAGLGWGWSYGTICWLASVWWTTNAFTDMLGWPWFAAWPTTLLICALQSAVYGLLGLACGVLHRRGERAGPLLCACLLTLLVALRPEQAPGSLLLALYSRPLAIQTAELGGMHLTLLLLLLVNWLAAELLVRVASKDARSAARSALALAATLLCIFGYGAVRLEQCRESARLAPDSRFASILTVQPNLPIRPRIEPGRTVAPTEAMTSQTLRAGGGLHSADLILWPEIPWNLQCDCDDPETARLAGRFNSPLLYACVELLLGEEIEQPLASEQGRGSVARRITAMYNSLWRVDPDGDCGRAYRKVELMPFGERTPLAEVLPWFRDLVGRTLEYSPGPGPELVRLENGLSVQPLVCVESSVSDLAARGVEMGADAFVNLADDAWFSSARAAEFHLALAVFRTVEFRRPLVRCTNSGFGAHVTAGGEIVAGTLTPAWQPAVRRAEVYCPQERTPYSRVGESWLWLAGLLVFLRLCKKR